VRRTSDGSVRKGRGPGSKGRDGEASKSKPSRGSAKQKLREAVLESSKGGKGKDSPEKKKAGGGKPRRSRSKR